MAVEPDQMRLAIEAWKSIGPDERQLVYNHIYHGKKAATLSASGAECALALLEWATFEAPSPRGLTFVKGPRLKGVIDRLRETIVVLDGQISKQAHGVISDALESILDLMRIAERKESRPASCVLGTTYSADLQALRMHLRDFKTKYIGAATLVDAALAVLDLLE